MVSLLFQLLYTSFTTMPLKNISNATDPTQIDVLNADFRCTNSDADNTWSQAADSKYICMALWILMGIQSTALHVPLPASPLLATNDNMKFNSSGGKDADSLAATLTSGYVTYRGILS
ncbi:MAG: hypothetical protein R2795_12060 [Saprospiraceae bacterium]